MFWRALASVCILLIPISLFAADAQTYVGSRECGRCHEKQYANFTKYSKKAVSWKAVSVMRPKLKEQELQGCYECHVTGYRKPGGFVSIEATPELADVGCETCHGPGSRHSESGKRALITRKPTLAECQACHNADRVAAFRYKPLIAAGAH